MQLTETTLKNDLRAVAEFVRRGQLEQARGLAAQMLTRTDDAAVHAFFGLVCCRMGDFVGGIPHLRAAMAKQPDDVHTAANLVTALIDTGALEEALAVASDAMALKDSTPRLWRLRGFLLQTFGDHEAARNAYANVVGLDPSDFESWNNLGNALAAAGHYTEGVSALERAVTLRPDVAPMRLNLATALLDAERVDDCIEVLHAATRDFPGDAKPLIELGALFLRLNRNVEAVTALKQATPLAPTDPDLLVRLGEAQIIEWELDDAELSFRAALAIDAGHAQAVVQLIILFEQTNRVAEMERITEYAVGHGIEPASIHFMRALLCRRNQRYLEGLDELAHVPPDFEPVRRARLEGEFRDRVGQPTAAFVAFREVNRLLSLEPSQPSRRAAEFRGRLQADRDLVTTDWYSSWTAVETETPNASPVFLVGFPRSGTTLLDTMLMGHSAVRVMEERPPIRRVEDSVGSLEALSALSAKQVAGLREIYFAEAAKAIDLSDSPLVVDKFPLHLNKVPYIHRLFPDAKFILALRHPCDVVLSCFITSFRLNNAMANFLDLGTTAQTYDLTMAYWQHCCSIMPLNVHTVSYENIIADSEGELRPLFDYLGLDWQDEALDHRRTASARGTITTASYSQITEPIYRRAAGRWVRYREQMAEVLPVLQPWVAQLGYSMDAHRDAIAVSSNE